MKIEFNVSLLGYSVGDYNNPFEIEIDKDDVEGMSEEEKEVYIENEIYNYILENLDYGYSIK